EILLIQYFRECYADFPKGILKPSESPDFIVQMKNNHDLGIELTRLNPANAEPPDDKDFYKIETRKRLIERTKELFEQTSQLKLFVKFLFSENHQINSDQEIMIAVQLVNEIRKAVQNKNGDAFFKETIPDSKLPKGLESVLIVNHPVMEISVWERANNLGVSNNVVDDIRKSIHKKDEKLGLYQKQRLNYYWLLVFTDRLRGVKNYNLANKIINHKFESRFQQVFLFDLIKSEIYRLI
ncbi:MAG TPA: hypothetical protein VLA03_04355, partial [Draconibacterium sp.]|nr:hypothetical protein [Draconibacterium sp.]